MRALKRGRTAGGLILVGWYSACGLAVWIRQCRSQSRKAAIQIRTGLSPSTTSPSTPVFLVLRPFIILSRVPLVRCLETA